MSQLQVVEPELTKLGYQILALSPDKPQGGAETREKLELSYRAFSDQDMAAARAFGIAYQVDEGLFQKLKSYAIDLVKSSDRAHKLLPVPAVFLTGTDGRVRFQYVNPDYKVRLAPEVLLAAARAALGSK